MLPAICLNTAGEEHFVFKIVAGKARKQPVHIGLHDGAKVEIKEGLTEDDVVVSRGKDVLREGQPVIPKVAAVAKQ
jgi:membrane fusion protein (multidrug efflux system)